VSTAGRHVMVFPRIVLIEWAGEHLGMSHVSRALVGRGAVVARKSRWRGYVRGVVGGEPNG